MDKQSFKEYSCVDLTEDEDSSEGDVGKDNLFQFVDCTRNFNNSIPVHNSENSVVTSPSKYFNYTIKPKSAKVKPSSEIVQATLGKKVEQYTSIQIRPPKYSGTNSSDVVERPLLKNIDAVTIPFKNDTGVTNCLQYKPQLREESSKPVTPENNAAYSPKKPPGKVVIIKKNNKYYKIIIPHNVMPNINQSVGPVLINIPEVGPLVISNDPQATKDTPDHEIQQLSLNLDAVEQKQNCDLAKKVPYLQNETLKDKKFCWTIGKQRKRDLDGFSATDRLGFTRSEVKRSRKCEKEVFNVLTRYQKRFSKLSKEYETFKMSLLKQENVTLVKINSIIERGKRKTEKSNETKIEPCENKNFNFSGKEEQSHPSISKPIEMDEYGLDLLVTKKIVILDKNNKEVRRKHTGGVSVGNIVSGRRKKSPVKSHQPKKVKPFNITPCYVQIVKDNRVEEAYKRLCGDFDTKKQYLEREKSNKHLDYHLFEKLSNTPKHVKANPLNVEESKAAEDIAMLLSRIVRSNQFLEKEMNVHKPILIETEQTVSTNRSLKYYCNEFSRYNIIFVVHPDKGFSDVILKSEGFVAAVEIGYIKLVDANLFSKFVKNGMKVHDSEDTGHYL